MKLGCLFLLLSLSAFGKTLDLDLQIKHRENSITTTMNSNSITPLGEEIVVTKNNLHAVFTAVETEIRPYGKNSRSAIEYSGKIYKMEKGEQKLIATPRVISPIGEDSSFTVSDPSSGEELVVSLKAQGLID